MTITLSLDKPDSSTRRTLYDLSLSVAKSKKIVVVTGAGISCSSGIPDFRSADGLYNLVKTQYPDTFLKGRDLFDASLFRDPTSTSIFYSFIAALKKSSDNASPTPTHKFIKTLDTKNKLLRSYTQNIDGLEEKAGLTGSSSSGAKGKGKLKAKEVRTVQLHGDIHRVRCIACAAELEYTEEHLQIFKEGKAPDCPECSSRCKARVARSARPLRVGTLRPAIVLYDEPHPLGEDIGVIQSADVARKPDMLIIMGTSLKVHGLKKLVKDFAKAVHLSASATTGKAKSWVGKVVFVNRTPPTSEWDGIIDYHVEGYTDIWVEKVLNDWKKMKPTDWEIQQTLDGKNGTLMVTKGVKVKLPTQKKKKTPDSENSRGGQEQSTMRPNSPIEHSPMIVSPRPNSPAKRRYSSYGADNSSHKKRSPERSERPDITPLQLLNDNTHRFEEMDLDASPELATEPKIKSGSLNRQRSLKQLQEPGMTMLRRTRSMSRAEGSDRGAFVAKRTK